MLRYNRLEEGAFETVTSRTGEEGVRIDSAQLAIILGGVRLATAQSRKRYHRTLIRKNPLACRNNACARNPCFYGAVMTKVLVLPNDLAACHAIIRDQAKRIAKLQAERAAALQFAFRKKLERYLAKPKQFVRDFGDQPEVVMRPRASPMPPWRRSLATSGGRRPPRRPAASSFLSASRGTR